MDNENNFNNPKKDTAKGKIILFAIGTLLGAVIASAAFLICVNTLGVNNNSTQSSQQMPGGTPPEMPSGQSDSSNGNSQSDQSTQNTPPEKPSDENNQNNQSTPPEKPNDNNSQTNN